MQHHPQSTPVMVMVHAHPDDESSLTGGTLARYRAAGVHTVLVTCTDGRHGDDGPVKPGSPSHDPHAVATRRSDELDRAATVLGIAEVVKLGYPDSGDHSGHAASDAFSQRPIRPMLERMVRVLRMHRPEVIVTYPSNGLTGHPDHIRAHDLVSAAYSNVVANEMPSPGQCGRHIPWRPRLYHVAMSRSRMRALHDLARRVGGEGVWAPPEDMAVDDGAVTTTIGVAAFWDQKLRALAAHASQQDAIGLLQLLKAAEPVTQVEEYVRVLPSSWVEGDTPDRADLFGFGDRRGPAV